MSIPHYTQCRLEPRPSGSFKTVRCAVISHAVLFHKNTEFMEYQHNRNGREVKIYDLEIYIQPCFWGQKK